MTRVLRNLKIREVSTVDKAANEHARIAFFKRDDAAAVNFCRIFGCPTLRDALDRAAANPALPRFKQDDGEEPPREEQEQEPDPGDTDLLEELLDEDEADDEETAARKNAFSQAADLFVEAHGWSRPTALRHVLHSARGRDVVRHLHRTQKLMKKERTTMTRSEELGAIAKKFGLTTLCKALVEDGPRGISEHELTKLIGDNVERRSGESSAQAFSRAFMANDDDGLLLRQAVNACKGFDVQPPPRLRVAPLQVGGSTAQDVDNPNDALRILEELAAKLRAAHPELSKSQAFSKIYTDPNNAALVRQERAQNRPAA
jgi:hypothetical protein